MSSTLKVASILVVKVRIDNVISPGLGRVRSRPRKSLGRVMNLHLKCFVISCCNLETASGCPAIRESSTYLLTCIGYYHGSTVVPVVVPVFFHLGRLDV